MKVAHTQQIIKNKKHRIIEAAVLVFAQKGYSSATVADIAAQAGIGKGRSEEHTSELQSR